MRFCLSFWMSEKGRKKMVSDLLEILTRGMRARKCSTRFSLRWLHILKMMIWRDTVWLFFFKISIVTISFKTFDFIVSFRLISLAVFFSLTLVVVFWLNFNPLWCRNFSHFFTFYSIFCRCWLNKNFIFNMKHFTDKNYYHW